MPKAPFSSRHGLEAVPWVNESKYMTYLDKHTIDEFISHSTTPYIAVLFHSRSCRQCTAALENIEAQAREWDEKGIPVIVGHVDASELVTHWKKKFKINLFPQLMLWHRNEANFSEKQLALMEFASTIKRGSGRRLVVTEDQDLLLDASRASGMAQSKDHHRLEGLGQTVWTDKVMLSDYTARVQLSGQKKPNTWFPLETLSFPDGTPTMLFKRPSAPIRYRDVHWGRAEIKSFVERMMVGPIKDLDSMAQLQTYMKDDTRSALILCADEVPAEDRSAGMGFLGLAKAWQDRHQAFLAKADAACPVSGEARPLLVVYSPAHQQWSATGKPVAAAVSIGLLDILRAGESLYDWFNIHRFPGMIAVSEYIFRTTFPAVRNIAMVAIDTKNEDQNKKVEAKIREVMQPVKPMSAEYPEVYIYDADTPYFGIVDGTHSDLKKYGIHPSELPRLVLFEREETWFEEMDKLSVWNMKQDLKNLDSMYKYGGPGFRSFLLSNFWRPWNDLDKEADRRGGLPARAALMVAIILFLLVLTYILYRVGRYAFYMLRLEEDSALRLTTIADLDSQKEKEKEARRVAKGLPPRKPKIHLPKQD